MVAAVHEGVYLLSSRAPARDLAHWAVAHKIVWTTIHAHEVPHHLRGSGDRGWGIRGCLDKVSPYQRELAKIQW